MKITKDFVNKIAELSKIKLSDNEKTEFTPQMQAILDSVETLKELDTKNVKITPHTTKLFSELREDIITQSQSIDDAMKNAPYTEETYIKVPGTTFAQEEA